MTTEQDFPRWSESENGGGNDKLQPPTLAQRLKEGTIQFAKDFRGISLRLLTYIGLATAESLTLQSLGMDQETATLITFGTLAATMVIGEVFVMDRLAQRLPWLKRSRMDFSSRRKQ